MLIFHVRCCHEQCPVKKHRARTHEIFATAQRRTTDRSASTCLKLIRRALRSQVDRMAGRASPGSPHNVGAEAIARGSRRRGRVRTMKVVDASAMVEVLVGGERSSQILSHLNDDLFAPELLIAEVQSALRRLQNAGLIAPDAANDAHSSLVAAPVEFVAAWPYAEQTWAWRHSLSSYDSCYVAVA